MDTVDVTRDKKGPLGETLILRGDRVPSTVSEAIKTFIKEKYDVAENTPIHVSHERATYLQVSTGDGECISTLPDGTLSAEWVPGHREDEVTRSPEGHVRNRRNLMSESALFPVEVKTGEYAELERDQREVLETVSGANTREHPLVIDVLIKKLPEQYEVSLQFL